jgi:hypothetical protein
MTNDPDNIKYIACLAFGFVLGLCGGLRIGMVCLTTLGRRIQVLEQQMVRKETP